MFLANGTLTHVTSASPWSLPPVPSLSDSLLFVRSHSRILTISKIPTKRRVTPEASGLGVTRAISLAAVR